MKRLTVDKDGAVGAGCDEIAGKPDHALDQKVTKRWMLEENDVSALGSPLVIGSRVGHDLVADTNGRAHRRRRNFVNVEAGLVHRVRGRWRECADRDNDPNERI
jgi:hypothetical protein